MLDLEGRNCLITGAASGIGRSLAVGLSAEGVNLFLADIDEGGLGRVKSDIEEKTGKGVYTGICDVSRYEDVMRLADEAYASLGEIDLLINNAGIAGAGFVETLSPDEWKHVIDVNAWSVIYSVNVFLPRMLERGTGHFVITGSGAGIVGIAYHAQYIASKFTVVGIAEALYSELKHVHKGIDVSVICPTFLKTNIIDRTPMFVPCNMLVGTTQEEIESRMDEFKSIFWEKYTQGALTVDDAVKKYIRGIKKNRLYILDTFQLRVAMILKGACEPLYKLVLKSEGKRHLRMIKETLTEMGIETRW